MDAGQSATIRSQLGRRPLGMNDAFAGRHPVDLAGPDTLRVAETVAVENFAREQIGHGRQPDMRMRANIQSAAGGESHWTHLVEEDERADRSALR